MPWRIIDVTRSPAPPKPAQIAVAPSRTGLINLRVGTRRGNTSDLFVDKSAQSAVVDVDVVVVPKTRHGWAHSNIRTHAHRTNGVWATSKHASIHATTPAELTYVSTVLKARRAERTSGRTHARLMKKCVPTHLRRGRARASSFTCHH